MKCRIYRWRASAALNRGAELSGQVRAHVVGCARCRAPHERERAVVAQLSCEARALSAPAPGALHARIMAGIRAGAAPKPRVFPVFSPVWLGAAAAVALVVGFVWWRGRAPGFQAPAHLATAAADAPSLSDLAEAVRPLAAFWEHWRPTPLEAESAALREDLARAGRHLYACLEP